MQIKSIVRYHLITVRMANQQIINQVLLRVWGKGSPRALLVQTGAAAVENKLPYDPAVPVLGIYLKKPKMLI